MVATTRDESETGGEAELILLFPQFKNVALSVGGAESDCFIFKINI